MSADIKWILEALERDPSKTRAGIARILNVDKSAITRLLSGERQLKFHEAEKIAAYIGIAPGYKFENTLADKARAYKGPTNDIDQTAPIYEVSLAEKGAWQLNRFRPPIDHKPRAPQFKNAANVFGFYAPDGAMAPRFRAGEIVWVDLSRPPEPGNDVLLIEKDAGPDGERVILAELVKNIAAGWNIIQYTDSIQYNLMRRHWNGFYVFPRY